MEIDFSVSLNDYGVKKGMMVGDEGVGRGTVWKKVIFSCRFITAQLTSVGDFVIGGLALLDKAGH